MTTNADSGIVSLPGNRSVDETVGKLEEMLKAKGVKPFALVQV